MDNGRQPHGAYNYEIVADQEVFSTGQIARMCMVAPRTVSKWIDSGRLPGIRLPGSMDRRVYRDDLTKFITEAGMRLPRVLQDAVTFSIWLSREVLGVEPCLDELDLGAKLAVSNVKSVVIGDENGANEQARLTRSLRDMHRTVNLVLVVSEGNEAPQVGAPVRIVALPAPTSEIHRMANAPRGTFGGDYSEIGVRSEARKRRK